MNNKAIAYLLSSHQIAIYEGTGLLSKIKSGASNIQDVVPMYSIIYILLRPRLPRIDLVAKERSVREVLN